MVRIAGVDLGACRDHMAVAMARLEGKVFKVDACITTPLVNGSHRWMRWLT
jgi:hypothetical protein